MRRVLPRRMGWVLVILMSGVGIPTNASIPAPIGARLGVRRALDSTMTGPPPIVYRLLGKARFGVMMGKASELFGRAGGGGRLEVLGDRPVELALALPQQAERAKSSRYPLPTIQLP
ncbi:MAG: hypothetical protein V3U60_08820 [Gammaproteobacteria bacterium]